MSQTDDNSLPAVPPPMSAAPQWPQPLNPPPGYIGATGPNAYPYPAGAGPNLNPHHGVTGPNLNPYMYPAAPPVQVNMYAPPAVAKNPGLAALLAGLFGCLGMLYSTVPGAFIMFGINVVLFIAGIFTVGIAWFLLLFTWIGGIVWAYMAAEEHNRRMLPPLHHQPQYAPTAPY